MKSKGIILLYNLSQARERQILPICTEFGIRVRKVGPSEYGEKIGALAGRPGFVLSGGSYDGGTFDDEMLVMDGFSRSLLDDFLGGFRKYRIAPVALKAVVTDHNSEWDSFTLHEEISKEHEAMKNYKNTAQ